MNSCIEIFKATIDHIVVGGNFSRETKRHIFLAQMAFTLIMSESSLCMLLCY